MVYAARTPAAARARSQASPRAASPRAVLQPHVDGDLIKFYGIGPGGGAHGEPPWFRWFYHKDQQLSGHAFDRRRARAPRAPGRRRARPRDLRRRLHRDRRGRARPHRPQRVAELRALPRGGGLRHRRVPVGALRGEAA